MTDYAINPHDGVRLAYEVTGRGEPLLLVHGTGLSKAIWRGLGYQRRFRDDYTVISVDMRGHGRSDKPHEDAAYRMDNFLADVEAVLAACGTGAVHYLGYSFGARVGLALAAERPARLRSLSTVGGTIRSLQGQVGSLFFPDYLAALEHGGMEEFISGWSRRAGAPVDPVTAHAFRANDPLALAAYLRQSEAEPGVAPQTLAQIQVPALLMAGTADTGRLEDARRAAALMPHARFHALEGRNHGTSLMPVDEITGQVSAFIASLPGRAAQSV